jgi:hypothetical protein
MVRWIGWNKEGKCGLTEARLEVLRDDILEASFVWSTSKT